MKSLRARVDAIQKAAERLTAGETVVPVLLVSIETREESAALDAYHQSHPAPPAPPARGRIRLELAGSIDASEYLRQRGVVLPETETREGKDFDNGDLS